jgi:RNA polymerase sigma-70 factor (ECF subfamily)
MSHSQQNVAACPLDEAVLAQMRPALVRYFLRKCRDPAEAEDLTQEVLARMLGDVRWESIEHAKGYIFRTAVNRWHDRQRQSAARGPIGSFDEDECTAPRNELTPERVLGARQELEHVLAALLALDVRTRDIFVLVRFEHMKQPDIARLLGVSLSTVEKHLARALIHLGQSSGRQGKSA